MLRDWQHDAAPMQLHPGDLGWYWRFGAEAMAAACGPGAGTAALAIGFLDGPDVLRMTVAPQVWREEELARQVVADVAEPRRGVLPAGKVSVEAPDGSRVQDCWPRRLERRRAVDAAAPRPRGAGGRRRDADRGHRARAGVRVHRRPPVGLDSSRFTDELWRAMAAGLPFADARCLLGLRRPRRAVAGVTVWSAGAGKPGLLEPMGVHADHRGRGYGRAICLAAAAELKKLGSSSALVCTPSSLAPPSPRTGRPASSRFPSGWTEPDRSDEGAAPGGATPSSVVVRTPCRPPR